jgi:predicted DCC family thiol-disulfide oxidoreductase YuxK
MSILTTFFDGGCPLCRREIAHYRQLDRRGAIRWVDILDDRGALEEAGIDRETAMRRLHVAEADGTIRTGVPAFVAIWRRLPGYRYLATLVDGLGLVRPLDLVYGRFADWRLKRRCTGDACGVTR